MAQLRLDKLNLEDQTMLIILAVFAFLCILSCFLIIVISIQCCVITKKCSRSLKTAATAQSEENIYCDVVAVPRRQSSITVDTPDYCNNETYPKDLQVTQSF